MFPAFLASWTKLRRPALLWGTYGALAVLSALITTLIFVNAGETAVISHGGAGGGPPGQGTTTLASLAGSSGLLTGLSSSVMLIGVVALCVAASQIAGEYSQGTLRTLAHPAAAAAPAAGWHVGSPGDLHDRRRGPGRRHLRPRRADCRAGKGN